MPDHESSLAAQYVKGLTEVRQTCFVGESGRAGTCLPAQNPLHWLIQYDQRLIQYDQRLIQYDQWLINTISGTKPWLVHHRTQFAQRSALVLSHCRFAHLQRERDFARAEALEITLQHLPPARREL